MALLAFPAVRRNSGRLYGAAVLVVAGVHREPPQREHHRARGRPGRRATSRSLAEGIITLMLVAIGIAAFGLAVRFLPVMHHVEEPELVAGRRPRRPLGLFAPVPVRS